VRDTPHPRVLQKASAKTPDLKIRMRPAQKRGKGEKESASHWRGGEELRRVWSKEGYGKRTPGVKTRGRVEDHEESGGVGGDTRVATRLIVKMIVEAGRLVKLKKPSGELRERIL